MDGTKFENVVSECFRLAGELEAAHRADYVRQYPSLPPEKVTIAEGGRWIRIDIGSSGAFMVDKTSGLVHGIRAYGVPHPRVIHGPVDQIRGADLLPRRWARAGIASLSGSRT